MALEFFHLFLALHLMPLLLFLLVLFVLIHTMTLHLKVLNLLIHSQVKVLGVSISPLNLDAAVRKVRVNNFWHWTVIIQGFER